MRKILISFIFFSLNFTLISQTTLIKGKVSDASNNDPIPFATIYFQGTDIAVQTDFEGIYEIEAKTGAATDTLICMNDGYYKKMKFVVLGDTQTIDFQIEIYASELGEVVFTNKEDPAYNMIRKSVLNRDQNNKKSLKAYEYENYNKIELDIDNISQKTRNRRAFRQIGTFMDSLQKIVGEDGKPILPIYISESISKVYFKNDLPKQTEHILATRIKGIGVQDGSLVSQLIGSSFVEYNFYHDNISILNKTVPSPITSNWKVYYRYFLLDSMFIGDEWCYKIDVSPKNKLDVAFSGTIWLAENTWAVKRADLIIGKQANINFIDRIKIQQESEKTPTGQYFPIKGRVIVDISELADSAAGMVAKYYYSSKNVVTNVPKSDAFYKEPIHLDEYALDHNNDDYWLEHRHDTLTQTEKNVYKMVDSLKHLPVVKTYTEIIDIAINGYKKIGKIDIGPYLLMYTKNNVEGSRFRLGFRTNASFSRKVVFKGYLAYGTKDQKFKYNIGMKYIFSRKNWTVGEINYGYDLNQLAFFNNDVEASGLFNTFTKWGIQRRPFYGNLLKLNFNTDLFSGFVSSISLKMRDMQPLFNYGHYNDVNNVDAGVSNSIVNAELGLTLRYAYREILLQNDNDRVSLGTNKQIPIVTLGYTQGLKGVNTPFGTSSFNYGRVNLRIQQKINVSFLGTSSFDVNSVRYLNTLPYPLLSVHLGNETFFNNTQSYNLMNFFEFVSDRYTSLNYVHNFNGFFMNRVPLIKKLKLREFVGATFLKGGVNSLNQNYIPVQYQTMSDGRPDYQGLTSVPYIETYYGIENLFKFVKIDFIHRLTYRDVNYKIHKFGIKVSAQFRI